MAKLQPSVQTLHYRLTGTSQYGYIDLAESLSIVNRRFYRQGMQFTIAGISLYNGSSISGRILVEKLPTTWASANAWMKAFSAWRTQQNEAIADSGSESSVAAFRDFKIFADVAHMDSYLGGTSNLLPQTSSLSGTGGSSDPLQGEWEYSQIVIPNSLVETGAPAGSPATDPAEWYLYMVGENNNFPGKGLIDGYQASRAYPQSPDPDTPTIGNADNWMRAMFDVGNDNAEAANNAVDKNDNLPYSQTEYPGSELQFPNLQLHDMIDITSTTVGGHSNMKGGVFPCGLLKIYKEQPAVGPEPGDLPENVLDVLIHLVPGNSRGYLMEPMQDM